VTARGGHHEKMTAQWGLNLIHSGIVVGATYGTIKTSSIEASCFSSCWSRCYPIIYLYTMYKTFHDILLSILNIKYEFCTIGIDGMSNRKHI